MDIHNTKVLSDVANDKNSSNNGAVAKGNTSGSRGLGAEKEKQKTEKKLGFFARWKESTSKAYDAHRAAGGNL